MTYTIVVLFIIALLSTLSILGEKKKRNGKLFLIINASLFAVGAVMLTSSYFAGVHSINALDSGSDLYSWSKEFFDLYFDMSMWPFAFLLVITVIAAILGIFSPKYQTPVSRVLRHTVSLFSSLLLLLIPFYGYFTQNESVPLLLFMALSGIGQALMIRASNAIDLISQIRVNRGIENVKSKK